MLVTNVDTPEGGGGGGPGGCGKWVEPEVIDKAMLAWHKRICWVAQNGGKWYRGD